MYSLVIPTKAFGGTDRRLRLSQIYLEKNKTTLVIETMSPFPKISPNRIHLCSSQQCSDSQLSQTVFICIFHNTPFSVSLRKIKDDSIVPTLQHHYYFPSFDLTHHISHTDQRNNSRRVKLTEWNRTPGRRWRWGQGIHLCRCWKCSCRCKNQ